MQYKLGSIYFTILGIAAVYFGALQFTGACGMEVEKLFFIKEIADHLSILFRRLDYMNLWEGLVVLLGGLLIMWGAFELRTKRGLGTAIMGSVMICLAGIGDFMKMAFCGIGDPFEGAIFNTLSEFLETIGPPYSVATWSIPFTLVIVYFIRKRGREEGAN